LLLLLLLCSNLLLLLLLLCIFLLGWQVAALFAEFDEEEGHARAGTFALDASGRKPRVGGRLEEATLCEKIAREYAREDDDAKATR
jgi:hypothetical protein